MCDESPPGAAWESLHDYLSCVHHAVSVWRGFLTSRDIDWMTSDEIADWLNRLEISLISLRDLHSYDHHATLNIAPMSSGLPKQYHIGEVERLHETIDPAIDYRKALAIAKRRFLDHLFESKEASISLLHEISQVCAKMRLQKHRPLRSFHWCGIKELNPVNHRKVYHCAWERYTIQPLPVRYVMLFEVGDDWEPQEEAIDRLKVVLEEETDGLPKLAQLGRDIDRSHAHIHPKWIGRVILGPLFISHITQDDHQLQRGLDSMGEKRSSNCASRIIYEHVLSDGERPMNSLNDPHGYRHQVLQDFGVRLQGECYDREVTHLEKHLFAPHAAIQLLDEEYRKEIGHQLHGG